MAKFYSLDVWNIIIHSKIDSPRKYIQFEIFEDKTYATRTLGQSVSNTVPIWDNLYPTLSLSEWLLLKTSSFTIPVHVSFILIGTPVRVYQGRFRANFFGIHGTTYRTTLTSRKITIKVNHLNIISNLR